VVKYNKREDKQMKKIGLVLAILIILGVGGYFLYDFINKSNEDTDALNFKEEHEAINGVENENNGKNYRDVTISEDNPIVYVTEDDILAKIKSKETFVVYFGYARCPWCRSVIESLIKVSNDLGLDKLYYVDIEDIRDVVELDINNDPVFIFKGTDGYRELLTKLSSVLKDYTLTDEEGNEILAGEKRIYAPDVVTVIEGKVTSMEMGISDLQTDAYMDLTDDIIDDTYKRFEELLVPVVEYLNTCSDEDGC